jgi:deferrochelatase/peroxidase EfeB
LCIYAPTAEELESETEVVEESLAHHDLAATAEDLYLPEDGRDHFGFAAPNTNPRIRRLLRRNKNVFDPSVPPGEFILGYRDARGYVTEGPRAPIRPGTRPLPRLTDYGRAVDLGRNGTFLAMRKLAQDVPGFMNHIRARAAELSGDPRAGARLAGAELVGRFPSGAPLALYGANEPDAAFEANRFGYRGEEGARCPVSAHARRANPRDSLCEDPQRSLERLKGHRLLRRGRLYGERYEPETPGSWQRDRGLMFVGVNASLRRQFEFVQGALLGGSAGAPGSLQSFVRVRGGLYLFMPGLTALGYLSEL